MTDKEWLLKLADRLDSGADFFEEPEGTLWMEITHGAATEMVIRLRAIAERLKDD